MSESTVLALVDVVVFAVLVVWFVVRTILGSGGVDRVSSGVHAVMAAAMVAMPLMVVPSSPQIVGFSAAALWYVGLGLFRPRADADLGVGHAGHGRAAFAYHAVMMASMVWMAVAMQSDRPSPGGMSGMSMDAMPMGNGSGAGLFMDAGAMSGMVGSAGWAVAVSVLFGLFFAVGALWLLVGVVRQSSAAVVNVRRLLDAVASALMAAGMSYAFLVLMS